MREGLLCGAGLFEPALDRRLEPLGLLQTRFLAHLYSWMFLWRGGVHIRSSYPRSSRQAVDALLWHGSWFSCHQQPCLDAVTWRACQLPLSLMMRTAEPARPASCLRGSFGWTWGSCPEQALDGVTDTEALRSLCS